MKDLPSVPFAEGADQDYTIGYRLIGYDETTKAFAVAIDVPTPLLSAALMVADPQLPDDMVFVEGDLSPEQVF